MNIKTYVDDKVWHQVAFCTTPYVFETVWRAENITVRDRVNNRVSNQVSDQVKNLINAPDV